MDVPRPTRGTVSMCGWDRPVSKAISNCMDRTGALLGTATGKQHGSTPSPTWRPTAAPSPCWSATTTRRKAHGTYALNLSQIPEAFIVPAGDGSGPLINGTNAGPEPSALGRQDLWTFTGQQGGQYRVRLGSAGFEGNLQLYGPTGELLGTTTGNSTDQPHRLHGDQQRHLHRAGQQLPTRKVLAPMR